MRAAWLMGFLIAGLHASALAFANEEADALKVRAAAEEFDAGRRAFLQKDFPSAAAHFENAFRDVPRVEALRLAMRAHYEAGNRARAATLAETALRRYSDDAGTAALARTVLAELRGSLVRLSVTCSPDCDLVVDQRAVFAEAIGDATIYLEPGKHAVAATWDQGRARRLEVEGPAGYQTMVVFRAPEETATPPVPAPTSPVVVVSAPVVTSRDDGLSPAFTYAGAGLTAVLAGVTIWSGIDTRNTPGRETVELVCVDQGESCEAYQDGRSRQLRTNVLLGVTAGAAVATGVVALFFTNWGGDDASEQRVGVRPELSFDGGVAVRAVGRF